MLKFFKRIKQLIKPTQTVGVKALDFKVVEGQLSVVKKKKLLANIDRAEKGLVKCELMLEGILKSDDPNDKIKRIKIFHAEKHFSLLLRTSLDELAGRV